MITVIPGRKHFSVFCQLDIFGLSVKPHAQETWEFIRDKENHCTRSWSKVPANKVLMSSHPPGYFGSSVPPSASSQNKTNGGSHTAVLYRVNSAIPGKNNRTLNAFCSLPKLNHLDRAGISVWFLPCLVAERNILPWIRQTLSNQRCLDAVRNVIFPFTALAQFIAAHFISLYEAVLEKKQPHSLAEIVCAALWASFCLSSDNAQNHSAIQNSSIQPFA